MMMAFAHAAKTLAGDGQFRIPNPKDLNLKLSKSKMPLQLNYRILFILCLQTFSGQAQFEKKQLKGELILGRNRVSFREKVAS